MLVWFDFIFLGDLNKWFPHFRSCFFFSSSHVFTAAALHMYFVSFACNERGACSFAVQWAKWGNVSGWGKSHISTSARSTVRMDVWPLCQSLPTVTSPQSTQRVPAPGLGGQMMWISQAFNVLGFCKVCDRTELYGSSVQPPGIKLHSTLCTLSYDSHFILAVDWGLGGSLCVSRSALRWMWFFKACWVGVYLEGDCWKLLSSCSCSLQLGVEIFWW